MASKKVKILIKNKLETVSNKDVGEIIKPNLDKIAGEFVQRGFTNVGYALGGRSILQLENKDVIIFLGAFTKHSTNQEIQELRGTRFNSNTFNKLAELSGKTCKKVLILSAYDAGNKNLIEGVMLSSILHKSVKSDNYAIVRKADKFIEIYNTRKVTRLVDKNNFEKSIFFSDDLIDDFCKYINGVEIELEKVEYTFKPTARSKAEIALELSMEEKVQKINDKMNTDKTQKLENKMVGYIGEIIFDLILKEQTDNLNKLLGRKIVDYDWTAYEKPKADRDFTIVSEDATLFGEVKATNTNNEGFELSFAEHRLAKENQETWFLAKINIKEDMEKLFVIDGKINLQAIEEYLKTHSIHNFITIYKFTDIENNFNTQHKGFRMVVK